MYKITEKFLAKLLKDYSVALVGRLCKNVESLQRDLDKNSPEYKYLSHVKELHREKIYETFRDLKNNIRAYNKGLKFRKFSITPSDQCKID